MKRNNNISLKKSLDLYFLNTKINDEKVILRDGIFFNTNVMFLSDRRSCPVCG